MLIKIGDIRINGNHIVSYRADMSSSIIIQTIDGKTFPFGFKTIADRDSALAQLDMDMSKDGFSEFFV